MAINADRIVALDTEDEVVRFYTTGVLSRAKTKFPRLQGFIKNLDVTHNGGLHLARHPLILLDLPSQIFLHI